MALPNGGSRDRREAARLTAQGVKPGVPDLFIPRAAGRFHGLFIEMKREKGGKISQHQAEWIALLRREGYAAYACPGFDNARMVIEKYLAGRLAEILIFPQKRFSIQGTLIKTHERLSNSPRSFTFSKHRSTQIFIFL